jgi:hypothetical protein
MNLHSRFHPQPKPHAEREDYFIGEAADRIAVLTLRVRSFENQADRPKVSL